MDEKIYKITLADGTEIENLTLNGNNFVSKTPIDYTQFEDNLTRVTINDGDNDDIHENMEFVGESVMDGNYLFILRDISAKELADMKLRSDVEYLAMMCDVEL